MAGKIAVWKPTPLGVCRVWPISTAPVAALGCAGRNLTLSPFVLTEVFRRNEWGRKNSREITRVASSGRLPAFGEDWHNKCRLI